MPRTTPSYESFSFRNEFAVQDVANNITARPVGFEHDKTEETWESLPVDGIYWDGIQDRADCYKVRGWNSIKDCRCIRSPGKTSHAGVVASSRFGRDA